MHVPSGTTTAPGNNLSTRSLRLFFLGAFGLSWGPMSLYMAFQDQFDAVFGPMGYTNPLFILGVYTPGIVGVFMVWHHYGTAGLASFF
ncbi:MAG: hypothetical protein ACTHKG_20075, partial [Nocardioides sp.]